ncbi:outer membrane beta-barrel protein [Sphingomonas turrisvirgatae]|uniref:Uncharacterized protein n=1 Tax=Sphingomonas turrisvirgatae TaxID=1888892 RepID=A0A1E3LRU0_9SPHN|nr:outer membrane beta-barrel protein [Sphingomonas turrisvirgatae]ODP36472.1 hypothetical protein BFL28_05650 [Sphingomonas turrisvirgatae]
MKTKLKMQAACLGVVAATVMASGTQAQAQEASAAGSTFGTPTREVNIELAGEATYDSNIARSNAAGAAARGLEREDVRFSPSIEADLTLPTGPAVVTLAATVAYDFHARNSQLDRERLNLQAGAASKFAMCDVGVQGGYSRRQNDLGDLSIIPGDPEGSAVNVQDVARIGGSVSCGSIIRPTAYIDYRTTRNSADQRKISDVNLLTYGGGVSYRSPAFGILTAFVGRTEFDYPDRRAFAGALQGFDLMMYGLRLDRRLGTQLQFNGQIYYVNVNAASGLGDSFDGLNWDAAASLRLGANAQLTVSAAKIVDASSAFNLRAAKVSTYGATLDYVFSPLLRGSLYATRRERDFATDPLLPVLILLNDDRTTEVGARLDYTIGRRIGLNLAAGYQDRDADVAVYDYSAFRATVGVSLRL